MYYELAAKAQCNHMCGGAEAVPVPDTAGGQRLRAFSAEKQLLHQTVTCREWQQMLAGRQCSFAARTLSACLTAAMLQPC